MIVGQRDTTNTTISHAGRPMGATWKFLPPVLPNKPLLRTRLTQNIEQCLGKKGKSGGVFLVSAPAGYGKTTILAQWAQNTSISVAWLHLDSSDSDPATLICDICTALRQATARDAVWSSSTFFSRRHTSEGVLSNAELRRVSDLLIKDIQNNVRRPLALIITGITELQGASQAKVVLDRLLSRNPDHLRVALEFREFPSLRLSQLLTQKRLDGIGLDALRLTNDEFCALMDNLDCPLSGASREQLSQLCDGWITGALLATGALWPDFLTERFPSSLLAINEGQGQCGMPVALTITNREAIFDYLADEVIDRLPNELSDFAVKASILSAMSAPLCSQLFEEPRAQSMLVELEQCTGLLNCVGRVPNQVRYTFQPLLRQALLSRLHAETTHEQLQNLHIQAGRLLEARGDVEDALLHFIAAGQFDIVSEAILGHSGALLRAGRGVTLNRWLSLLPEPVRQSDRRLLCLDASLRHQSGDFQKALELASLACQGNINITESDDVRQVAEAHCIRAWSQISLGAYVAARLDCEKAISFAPSNKEVQVQAHFALATCLKNLENPKAAEACLSRIAEMCRSSNDLWMQARFSYFRSQLAVASSAFAKADEFAIEALHTAQAAGDEIVAIGAHLQLGGATKQYLGDLRLANYHLELAESLSEAAAYPIGQIYALVNRADLWMVEGKFQSASDAYERVLPLIDGNNDKRMRVHTYVEYCNVLTILGEPERARALLEPLVHEYESDEAVDDSWALLALVEGLVHGRLHDYQQAETWLDIAEQHTITHQHTIYFLRMLIYRAVVQQEQGKINAASKTLERLTSYLSNHTDTDVGSLYVIHHFPNLWPLLVDIDNPGLTGLLQRDSVRAAMSQTLNAQSDNQQNGNPLRSIAADKAQSELRVFLLGEPRILLHDQIVEYWRKPQAGQLLFYLLEQGRPVHKEKILEALWPNRDPEQADRAFTKARFYLKSLLRSRDGCLQHEKDLWRLTLIAHVDTSEFEQQVSAGRRLLSDRKPTEAAEAFRRALSLWKGEFLEGNFDDWAILRRDSLRRQYLSSMETLAQLELRLRHLERGAELFYSLLESDPLNEVAHRGLMVIHMKRGAFAQACHQYDRCRQALLDEGLSPASETVALYKRIQASQMPSATPLKKVSGM